MYYRLEYINMSSQLSIKLTTFSLYNAHFQPQKKISSFKQKNMKMQTTKKKKKLTCIGRTHRLNPITPASTHQQNHPYDQTQRLRLSDATKNNKVWNFKGDNAKLKIMGAKGGNKTPQSKRLLNPPRWRQISMITHSVTLADISETLFSAFYHLGFDERRRIVEGSTKVQKRNFDHFVDGGFCKMIIGSLFWTLLPNQRK